MEMRKEQIAEEFNKGLNCAQIVLLQFCEKYSMKKEDALRLGCGFGGGARVGELCGAVSGSIMVIGLKHGNRTAENTTNKIECYEKTKEFMGKFKDENGSVVCRDLLQCDISTEDGMSKARNDNLFQTRCVDAVASAIGILKDLGY